MDRVEAFEFAEDSGHRVGKLCKERPEPVQITSSGVVGCEGREIRIAVQTIRPDRQRQERLSRSKHGRPRVYPPTIDKEAPAYLAEMPRMDVSKNESPNGRMNPVGSDDEVIRARRTISEGDVDFVILLTQRCQRGAKPHRDARGALDEDAMKLTTSDAYARANRVPEL